MGKITIMFDVKEIPLNKQRLVISDFVVLDFGYIICFMNQHYRTLKLTLTNLFGNMKTTDMCFD
jgi:hypothetical protein